MSVVAVLASASLVATGLTAPPVAALGAPERQLVELVNAARARLDLRPLAVRDDLSRYAGRHSTVMAEQGRLYHSGGLRSICCWSAIAENVGYGPDVVTVHRALMRSEPHRENLLARGMRGLGVGVETDADDRVWVTQVFRRPR
jgi:uncharacterized protein YkwD